MATYKTNSALSELKGKIDGLIFYQQQGKMVVRSAGENRHPRSALQSLRLAAQRGVTREYSRLSAAERTAWDDLAGALRARSETGDGPRDGYLVFVSVNTARVLAGQAVTVQPPDPVVLPGPEDLASASIGPHHRLSLVIHHTTAAGAGWWRVRITPPTASLGRQAESFRLRLPTSVSTESFVPIGTPKQQIQLQLDPALVLEVGRVVGIEVMAFSAGYVRGGFMFWRRVTVAGSVGWL